MPRRPVMSRAVRTALVATVLAAVTAGVVVSGDHQEPGAAAAGSPTSTPSVQVDPVSGAVGIDPTGPVATPSTTGAGIPAASASMAALPGHPAYASSAAAGSAVTVHGSGEFSGLAVTVGQTTNLVDQTVVVSWTGGAPTLPLPGSFGQNYMELMECWGDDPSGPDRTQCQYGSFKGDNRGGQLVGTRQLNYGDVLDPAEPIKKTGSADIFVPFHSVRGTVETGSTSKLFDAGSTNEVPFAQIRADGTGQAYFETETGQQAPGLGCGVIPDNLKVLPAEGRKCWLVIVPRGLNDVNKLPPMGGKLVSSPLSTSNWAHRMVVPLHYTPIGQACPLSAPDLYTSGTEMAKEAMFRWAPQLCKTSTINFRYTKIDDNVARNSLNTSDNPGLQFVSDPEPPSTVAAGRSPVYGPIGLSGVTIAFDIESQSSGRSPDPVRARDGQRISRLNLTPRLVAKLLTQSYVWAVNFTASNPLLNPAPSSAAVLAKNPVDMTTDPDFMVHNPQFQGLSFRTGIYDLLLPPGQSDVARRLWAWVEADPAARAWLSGTADHWGMAVNPNYRVPKPMTLPRDDFPKSDPYCQLRTDAAYTPAPDPSASPGTPTPKPVVPKLCTLDNHPYANDMHDAARAAARGDTLSRNVWSSTAIPPAFGKDNPQAAGVRGVLAVTDTATAIRYGLSAASLQTGTDTADLVGTAADSPAFVAPTSTTMTAAVAAMTKVPGTTALTLLPKNVHAGIYPLTMLTYAVAAPATMTVSDARNFAKLIEFAVGPGQTPGFSAGQLSQGYVPLPQNLRAQALAMSKAMVAGAIRPAAPAKPAAPVHHGSGGTATTPPTTAPTPRTVVTVAPATPSTQNLARTAGTPVGAARYLLVGLLGAGAAAALAGPLLPRYLRRRRARVH